MWDNTENKRSESASCNSCEIMRHQVALLREKRSLDLLSSQSRPHDLVGRQALPESPRHTRPAECFDVSDPDPHPDPFFDAKLCLMPRAGKMPT
jgi:hypothetical protein